MLTFKGCLLGVFIIGDLCEVSGRFYGDFHSLVHFFFCILSVESSGESLERSFISLIVVDTLCEGVSI